MEIIFPPLKNRGKTYIITPEIEQSMVYGDHKNYLVAIIVPDNQDLALKSGQMKIHGRSKPELTFLLNRWRFL